MTRERAKELWPVIQAFSNGKTIQADYWDNPQGWRDYDGTLPGFDNDNWRWRVKPEPREFWLRSPRGYNLPWNVWLSKPDPSHDHEVIHVREVLE